MGLAVSCQRTAYTAMFFSFFFYFDSDGGTALGETLNSAGSNYAIRSKNCDLRSQLTSAAQRELANFVTLPLAFSASLSSYDLPFSTIGRIQNISLREGNAFGGGVKVNTRINGRSFVM